MKISRYVDPRTSTAVLGLLAEDILVDARSAWALGISEFELLPSYNATLFANLENGSLEALQKMTAEADPELLQPFATPAAEAHLLPPVDARSFRDFYAFEQHVRSARANRGLEMVPEWYQAPVFYFSNTACISGAGSPVRRPPETNELDYELELAVVIGREGGDISAEAADEYIAGFTILNDWSARDIQRREMKVGLGPAKGKDFATSLGPWLVPPSALENRRRWLPGRGYHYSLTMTAEVNGCEISRGSSAEMHWTFAELIAEASRNTVLRPGDLIGSGTVGTGCLTEFPKGTYPWLQPGDVVTLKIELLGELTTAVSQ
jgi:fumarylacetoacetate (FAA) hydrolase